MSRTYNFRRNITLYHGTLTALLPGIMEKGLRPRGKAKSHDEYLQMASMPQFVYLTSSYDLAVQHAARISERTANGADITVVGVELNSLDRDLLYPDEDYLSEEWNSDLRDWTVRVRLNYMKRHQDEWKESLGMMKTVAHRSMIPVTALTEYPVPLWMEKAARFSLRSQTMRLKMIAASRLAAKAATL
jgi:hypothetical protein